MDKQENYYNDLKKVVEQSKDMLKCKVNLTESEESYRRGYAQGFAAARRCSELKQFEVDCWRYSDELTAPPGSGMAGVKLFGLTK